MADQEIARHTKQVLHLASSKEHKGWHKLGEMGLEMITIVFAVTLSMWLHSWGEHRHEQKQVKAFLLGLKTDLQSDIKQTEDVLKEQHKFDKVYAYLAALPPDGKPDEKFDVAYDLVDSNAFLVPQVSRYEGFKQSGKLTNIEDAALLEKIITLYQYDLPKIRLAKNSWDHNHDRLTNYLDTKLVDADTPALRYQALTSPRGKRLAGMTQSYPQLYERHDTLVRHAQEIIAEIDKAYP